MYKLDLPLYIDEARSFYVERRDINGVALDVFANQPSSLGILFRSMASYGDADFLVYGDRRYSFIETYEIAESLASALQARFSIRSGDKVALVMSNTPEWCFAFIAVVLAGAVVVPIGADMKPDLISYIIDHSKCKLAFVESKKTARHLLSNSSISLIVQSYIVGGSCEVFAELLNNYEGKKSIECETQPDDLAALLYTSGSTSRPRGVLCSHRNILSSVMAWTLFGTPYNYHKNTKGNACLVAAPLSHATACHSLFIFPIMIGRKVVLMRHWNPIEAARLIECEQVTYFNGVPTMSSELVDVKGIETYDFSSLSHISSAGAKRPENHVKKIKACWPNITVMSGYGTTETNAMGTIAFGDDYVSHPGSSGYPVPPLVRVEVMTPEFTPCSVNQKGEVCIKSPSNAIGYWQDPESTRRAFRDGWHLTGDEGYFDDEKRLHIIGRIKDIIITGGENVSCAELEESIYSLPQVLQVAVIPVSDDRMGEVVGAVIRLQSGQELTEEDILSSLSQKLEWYKTPKRIWLTKEALPVLYNGKIDKNMIKQLYAHL